jgi:hypothetical protein
VTLKYTRTIIPFYTSSFHYSILHIFISNFNLTIFFHARLYPFYQITHYYHIDCFNDFLFMQFLAFVKYFTSLNIQEIFGSTFLLQKIFVVSKFLKQYKRLSCFPVALIRLSYHVISTNFVCPKGNYYFSH